MSRLRPSFPLLIAGPLLAAGCAVTPAQHARDQAAALSTEQRLDARLAGLVAQPPIDCLPALPRSHSEAFGSKIVYSVGRRLVYVNDTTGGCESLQRGDYLVTVSNEGRVCRGDIGRTFETGSNIPTGSCALGSFTPYKR